MSTPATASWAEFRAAEHTLAATVEKRFGRFRHHVIGTLRADGSPRLTGLEADFRFGELWLGMMPNSRKALDLRRDPRCALHANPGPDAGSDSGPDLTAAGDVRISGLATEVTDRTVLARYVEETGPPQPFHLFRVGVTEVVRTTVEGEELVVQVWHPGQRVRTVRRANDDSPPRVDAPPIPGPGD